MTRASGTSRRLSDCADDSVSEKGYPVLNKDAIAKGTWERRGEALHHRGAARWAFCPRASSAASSTSTRPRRRDGPHQVRPVPDSGREELRQGPRRRLRVRRGRLHSGGHRRHREPIGWNYWEYQYSLLAKSILWAAQRDGGVAIAALRRFAGQAEASARSAEPHEGDARRVRAAASSARASHGLRSKIDKRRSRGHNAVELPVGRSAQGGWPGGTVIFDVIVTRRRPATRSTGARPFSKRPRRSRSTASARLGRRLQGRRDAERRRAVQTATSRASRRASRSPTISTASSRRSTSRRARSATSSWPCPTISASTRS